MEELIKRINQNNHNIYDVKNRKYVNLNTKKYDLLKRLSFILYAENKKRNYNLRVIRIFTYYLTYLDIINSQTIKVFARNNKKYYYSSKLNLIDAEEFYLNSKYKNSTKIYYLSIIKKTKKLILVIM